MLSSDNNISSKRVGGIGCILVYILFIVLGFFYSLSEMQVRMLESLLYIGAALLGLGMLEKTKYLNGSKSNETK